MNELNLLNLVITIILLKF